MRWRLLYHVWCSRSDQMKILVLSPHTDDAELGAGGSICRFVKENHDLLWLVFSTAEESLPAGMDKDTLKNEFLGVLRSYGLRGDQSMIMKHPVRNFTDHRQEILETLVKVRGTFEPDLVIGPSLNDYHQDHQVVAAEMVRAYKSSSSIICYELPWNHVTFNTELFIRLKGEHIDKKIEVLKEYGSQRQKQRPYFSDEFIRGLAKTRGVQSNSDYAESFEVVRWRI